MERRSFVKKVGLASVMLSPTVSFLAKALGIEEDLASKLISYSFHLFRPEDLLDFEFTFINLYPDKTKFEKGVPVIPDDYKNLLKIPNHLIKKGTKGYMVVRLPQQHISEELLQTSEFESNYSTNQNFNTTSFVSGYSFLVFEVKLLDGKFPFSIDNILNWNLYDSKRSHHYFSLLTGDTISNAWEPTTYPPSLSNLIADQKLFSFFEVPYKLFLTPYSKDDKGKTLVLKFDSNELKGSSDIYEIWNNKLSSDNLYPSFRAFGFKESNIEEAQIRPNHLLPKTIDRHDIVQKSLLGYSHRTKSTEFLITALGASAKLRYIDPGCENIVIPDEEPTDPNTPIYGECNPNPINSLVEWKQHINLGRDEFIKVARIAFIHPFGIKVLEVEIGRRKNVNGISYVDFKKFIQRIEPKKQYRTSDEEDGLKNNDKNTTLYKSDYTKSEPDRIAAKKRSTPFKEIRLKTVISPPIAIFDAVGDYAKTIIDLQNKFLANANYHKLLFTDTIDVTKRLDFSHFTSNANNIYNLIIGDAIFTANYLNENIESLIKSEELSIRTKCLVLYVQLKNKILQDTEKFKGVLARIKESKFEEEILFEFCKLIYADNTSFEPFVLFYNKLNEIVKAIYNSGIESLHEFLSAFDKWKEIDAVFKIIIKDFENAFKDQITNAKNDLIGYWPKLENKFEEVVNFDFIGIDWEGKEIVFKSPFIVVAENCYSNYVKENPTAAELKEEYDNFRIVLSRNYNSIGNTYRRQIDAAGQRISYYKGLVDGVSSKISELETQIIEFKSDFEEGINDFKKDFPFYPELRVAKAQLPVIKEIIKNPEGILIGYGNTFLNEGIDRQKKNLEGILLEIKTEANSIVNQGVQLANDKIDNIFNNVSSQLAGIASPEMIIRALSVYENAYGLYNTYNETTHAVTGFINAAKEINPKKLAEDALAEAKLFGVLYLKELFKDELQSFNTVKDNLPISEVKDLVSQKKKKITYKWESKEGDLNTPANPSPFGIVTFYATNIPHSSKPISTIKLNFESIIDFSQPSVSVSYTSVTSFNKFGLGIAGIVSLYFEDVKFISSSAEKSDVKVNISGVEFSEILKILQQLQSTIGTLGKGLDFDIDFEKIKLGYQFSLPAISTGAFNLTNLSIGFDFNLYFKREPLSLTFNFGERDVPCLLSVGIFGGRFFMSMTLRADGIKSIEGLIEFGGVLAVSLGIAKGMVYLFAGLYYKQEKDKSAIIFGYVTCGGVLNVLGIIEISMVFYMGMKYIGNGNLFGYASVTVKIRIGFFKLSRDVRMEKRLSGNGASKMLGNFYSESENIDVPDNTLINARLITVDQWTEYAMAFN